MKSSLYLSLTLLGVVVAVGCRKSEREIAEENAIKRHNQEVAGGGLIANPAMRAALSNYFHSPDGIRTDNEFKFLHILKTNGQLPGISKDTKGLIRMEKGLADVTPDGGYSQEFHFLPSNAPSGSFYYVIGQTSSNNPLQLKKAWRTEGGKMVEEYPIR